MKDKEEPAMNSGALLEKIQLYEEMTFDLMSSKEKMGRNKETIENYKEMIRFLFENQSFKESELDVKLPGGVIAKVKRKEYVLFIQSEINKMMEDNKTEMLIYSQMKTSLIAAVGSKEDVMYLNKAIHNELNEDIERKFNKLE